MNDPIAFIVGSIFIGVGLALGLGCIGEGIKEVAKVLKEFVEEKRNGKPN